VPHHGLIAPDITLTLSTAGDTASITLTENATPPAHGHGAFAQVKEEPAERAGDTEQSTMPFGARTPKPHRIPEPFREFCMVSVLRNVLGVACWLIDSRITLLQADFPLNLRRTQMPMQCCFRAPRVPASAGRLLFLMRST